MYLRSMQLVTPLIDTYIKFIMFVDCSSFRMATFISNQSVDSVLAAPFPGRKSVLLLLKSLNYFSKYNIIFFK
jgi:hypothetical protein